MKSLPTDVLEEGRIRQCYSHFLLFEAQKSILASIEYVLKHEHKAPKKIQALRGD